MSLHRRQSVPGDSGTYSNNDDGYNWWWSDTGYAVRYAIIAGLFGTVLLYLIVGYIHARRRVKKGVPPLAYHRWMIRRHNPYPPHGGPYYSPYGPQAYPMNEYPAPPPAYNHAYAPPPTYQPPQGGSKVMPDQHFGAPHMSGAQQGEGSGVTVPPPARY